MASRNAEQRTVIPRLFVDQPLGGGVEIVLPAGQTHYLRHVLRLDAGARVRLFNGQDGEWSAEIAQISKKSAVARAADQVRPQIAEPPLTLMFAPLKRGPIDYLAEKATELGATCLQPVVTLRTTAQRVNVERLTANVREAAEQCERLTVPHVLPARALDVVLDDWPAGQTVLFCDERGGTPLLQMLLGDNVLPTAILIGPEGGFDERERGWLNDRPSVRPVSLGPRILRAETAAAAALAIWQAAAEIGDSPHFARQF